MSKLSSPRVAAALLLALAGAAQAAPAPAASPVATFDNSSCAQAAPSDACGFGAGVQAGSSEEELGAPAANPALYDEAAAPVPEPVTVLMLLLGLALLGLKGGHREASEKFSN
ncbi:MAG: PEP-CTERM sorting domain-containing protein [Pseudomonadota bacterium]